MCRMHISNVGLFQSLKVQPNNPNIPILKESEKRRISHPVKNSNLTDPPRIREKILRTDVQKRYCSNPLQKRRYCKNERRNRLPSGGYIQP